MDPLTNPAFLIFSSISPLLIALIKQQGFSSQVNAVIAFACYALVGIAGVLVSGEELTIENAVSLITVATVVGSAAYALLWNNIGGETPIETRIQDSTSFVK